METFTLSHPKRRPDPNEADNREEKVLPIVPGKNLHQYLKELHLNELRTHCSMMLVSSRERLRTSYMPKAGDVIKVTRAGKAMS
jgi:hypothetical protein